jgi:hypothetical protein
VKEIVIAHYLRVKVKAILTHRLYTPAIIALGVCLMIGSLKQGFYLDDHWHRIMFGAVEAPDWLKTAPWDGFRFFPADDLFQQKAKQLGLIPWWADENFQATFFRPLSSLSLALDYIWWPESPALIHLHSLLWFALLCVTAGLVLRQLIKNPIIAAIALTLFVLDDAHLYPSVWIANRNALIATTLALLTLWLHARGSNRSETRARYLAPACLALALLAGEYAVGILGFLFAYVVFLEDGSPGRKLRRLLPYGVVLLIWRAVYSGLGYGTRGGDLYLDPIGNPVAFVLQGLPRLPVLLSSALGLPSSFLTRYEHGSHPIVLFIIAVFVCGFVVWALIPTLRSDKQIRFYLLGTILSLVPSCATLAHERLLLLPGFGIAGLFAVVLHHTWTTLKSQQRSEPSRLPRAAFLLPLLISVAVISPMSLPAATNAIAKYSQEMESMARSLSDDVSGRYLIIMSAPDTYHSHFLPLWRYSLGLSVPESTITLHNGIPPPEVQRPEFNTFKIQAPAGLFRAWSDKLTRSQNTQIERGVAKRIGPRSFTLMQDPGCDCPTQVIATLGPQLNPENTIVTIWDSTGFISFTSNETASDSH